MNKPALKSLLIRIAVIGVVVLLVWAVFRFTPLSPKNFTPGKIRDFILSIGFWGPLVFIGIYALRAVILVIPVGVMSLAGGLAYGKWLGTVYILIGATLGATLSFLVARFMGRRFIEKFDWLHKGKIKKFDDGAAEHGFKLIVFIRLVPLFQYDAVNFGAGLSKIKFHHFVIGSFVGMIPGGFINAYLGSSLDNVLSVQFFVALGLFIMLMFIPTLYKKLKKSKGTDPQESLEHPDA